VEKEQSVVMNGVDLYADAHQEMPEIHMSVVYKVHASPMPSVQTTKHVRITTVLTHAQRLVGKGLIVEHKIMLPFVDAQEETQATLSRRVDDLPKMRSAKLVVLTLIAKLVKMIRLSVNANKTMSAIHCKGVDVNVKHQEIALSLRNANVLNACPSVERMFAVRMPIARHGTTGLRVPALPISLGMDILDVIQNVQNMTTAHKTRLV
jgi:hypothetical protein